MVLEYHYLKALYTFTALHFRGKCTFYYSINISSIYTAIFRMAEVTLHIHRKHKINSENTIDTIIFSFSIVLFSCPSFLPSSFLYFIHLSSTCLIILSFPFTSSFVPLLPSSINVKTQKYPKLKEKKNWCCPP